MSTTSSDTDTSSYKNFRQTSRERFYEMIRSAKTGDSRSTSKVLIVDKVTVKVMSCACQRADFTEEGVSLVEDIHKQRQPMPTLDAIYFIQPTQDNITIFLSDMSGRSPLYKNSAVAEELVRRITGDGRVLSRIGALRVIGLEYFAIDSQSFITNSERASEKLLGDKEISWTGDMCLSLMATRIASVFASLLEFPIVRYRAAKSLDPTMADPRDLIPQKLADGVWNCLVKYRSTMPNFPRSETCELLILDRSIDQIAPIIHEWTYDAMCHDLLNMDGNKYVHEVPNRTVGPPEKKEVLLEDDDPIWLELRHEHITDASERLREWMSTACQMPGSSNGGDLSARDLQKMVPALPQYSEQIEKLSLHVDIAEKINSIIYELDLEEVGKIEQDLVFGDAVTKDLVDFLVVYEDISRETKLRLLMIYAAVYPETMFDKGIIKKLMQLAGLQSDDMNAVYNMRLLPSSSGAKKSSSVPLFGVQKKKYRARKDRPGEEVRRPLSSFYPIIEELIVNLHKGLLSKNDYPCINDPCPSFRGTSRAASIRAVEVPTPHSMSYSLRDASSNLKKMNQRIFVFIVGGATRSELRVCHELSTKLKREIVLGSSSIDDPHQFITKLKSMAASEDLQN